MKIPHGKTEMLVSKILSSPPTLGNSIFYWYEAFSYSVCAHKSPKINMLYFSMIFYVQSILEKGKGNAKPYMITRYIHDKCHFVVLLHVFVTMLFALVWLQRKRNGVQPYAWITDARHLQFLRYLREQLETDLSCTGKTMNNHQKIKSTTWLLAEVDILFACEIT